MADFDPDQYLKDTAPTAAGAPFDPDEYIKNTTPTVWDKLTGVGEVIANFGSGMIAEPISGLGGILGSLLPGEEGQGAKWIDNIQEAMTYQPVGEVSQQMLQDFGQSAPVQAIGRGMQAAEEGSAGFGEYLGGQVGAPGVGHAIGATLPTAALEILGFKVGSKIPRLQQQYGLPDEIIEELARQGIDASDNSQAGRARTEAGVADITRGEQQRLAGFEEEGIPTLQSRVSGAHGDFLAERQGARADTAVGRALRFRKAEEAGGFQDATMRYRDAFGIPEEAGYAVKDALKARITNLKADAKIAYDNLSEVTDGNSLPLIGNKVLEAFDSDRIKAMSGRLGQADRGKVNDLLIEYGLDTDADRVADWIERREANTGSVPIKTEITPLSINNFEEMRQALNGMSGYEAGAEISAVANALKKGLDDELTQFDEMIEGGTLGRDVADAAIRARSAWKTLKGAQNTDTLVGRLVGTKKMSPDEDLILSSEISKKLMSDTRDGSIENISKLIRTLEESPRGDKALGDIQSSIAARLLEKGISATVTEGGGRAWVPGAFVKEFDRLAANGRLDKLFENNSEGLESLKKIRDLSENTKSHAELIASGTADDWRNALAVEGTISKLMKVAVGASNIPGLGLILEYVPGVRQNVKASKKARQAAKRALNVKPGEYKKMMQARRLYPALFGHFVTGAVQETKRQAQDSEERKNSFEITSGYPYGETAQ